MAYIERRYQKDRTFRGAHAGERLATFLGNESEKRSHAFVLALMGDLKALLRHARPMYDGRFRVQQSQDFHRAASRVNRKIGRYKVTPQFSIHSADTWHFTELFHGSRKHSLDEFVAVYDLIRLAGDGLLERVRQCDYCNDWFFALFSHQKCCGAPRNCRVKLYHSSEEYKLQKREYAKKAYRDQRDKDKRLLARARKGD